MSFVVFVPSSSSPSDEPILVDRRFSLKSYTRLIHSLKTTGSKGGTLVHQDWHSLKELGGFGTFVCIPRRSSNPLF